MVTLEAPARSVSGERGRSNSYSNRSPVEHDRGSMRNGGSIRSPDENQNPPTMPKALGGMLKTTTETGDIGLFSIKPSRVPLHATSSRRISGLSHDGRMRKPRQFQPYGVPNIDDRRQLPSYARDTSSEVTSMHETASQKSASRIHDDSDYRSYSMTQTYSSYSLSNHRSYASLRSQPDAGRLLQRPRSPFAYPTRLKRPGFRPSSPALTDEGAIDYSRRAEIGRTPNEANYHTSSPASLYAQRRKPQLSLRPKANTSTPSLLSQSSPQRRSPSPYARPRSETPNNDWQRRNGSASINTSPARSTFSLASTVNPYQSIRPPSATTTPGKIPPPSPLYYDYTEDFDIDDYSQPEEALEPPPQFRVEKTIPEDRPLSSGWTSLDGSDMRIQKTSFNNILRNSTSPAAELPKSHDLSQDSSPHTQTSVFDSTQGPSSRDTTVLMKDFAEPAAAHSGGRRIIQLSGLGLGARELSSHVEEVFGLPPTASFEVAVSNTPVDEENLEGINGLQKKDEDGAQPIRNSSFSLNAQICRFPACPIRFDGQFSEAVNRQGSTLAALTTVSLPLSDTFSSSNGREKDAATPTMGPTDVGDSVDHLPPRSSSTRSARRRLNRPYSPVTENRTNELDELIQAFEEANRRRIVVEKPQLQSHTVLSAAPSASGGLLSGDVSLAKNFNAPTSSFNHLSNDNVHGEEHSNQGLRRGHQRPIPRRLAAVTVPTGSEHHDVPNFSHQFPRRLMSRSESPMLAPKAISPARQLKLRNSVPQLMKALPALPPDPLVHSVSLSPQLTLPEIELPYRFSSLLSESKRTSSLDALQPSPPKSQDFRHITSIALEPVELDSEAITARIPAQVKDEQKTSTPAVPSKLKLKCSLPLCATSPSESRPWNSEDSYPWSIESFNVALPSVIPEQKRDHPKPPKFKLKITRASNSTMGTVRVNRESGNSGNSAALHFRHPKDLFTPNSGIDNIFRKVSRHLHSRKPSASSSNRLATEDSPEPISTFLTEQISLTRSLTNSPQPSATSLNVASPNEIRSVFSDDSSYRRADLRGLGKSLSILRARITMPYGTANGARSHDDITWRSRNGQELPIHAVSRSIPNLHEGADNEATRPRRFSERLHTQRLRERFTLWLKGARSAIRARVKSRKAATRGDDQQLQLTAVV